MNIMDDQLSLAGMEAAALEPPAAESLPTIDLSFPPRLRRVDRQQVRMIDCSLDELLPADHEARMIWRVVTSLKLAMFEDQIAARGGEPGRAATDPRILIALWLYATCRGVGSGREIDRLRQCHDAYRWLAGGVSLNYHTINDFRVGHEAAMDDLLTQVVAWLAQHELIDVTRVAQDGIRVRAHAGSNTFRSETSLEKLLEEARAHVLALKRQNDPSLSARQRAKHLADAQDYESRLTEALRQLPALEAKQEAACQRSGREKLTTRVSTTDPDARVMKVADGGFRPAYNVQLAVDVKGRAIVGVEVTDAGGDANLDEPMRQQVAQRSGGQVKEQLMDGGYAGLEAIDKAETSGVTVYAPVGKPHKPEADPHARKVKDTDATFAWRQRMATEEAKTIYKQRASTVETVNGDLAEHRGLRQFPVRGSPKVRCVSMWMALAYNILRFGSDLFTAACEKS